MDGTGQGWPESPPEPTCPRLTIPTWYNTLRGVLHRAAGGLTSPPGDSCDWPTLLILEAIQSDSMTLQRANAAARSAGIPGVRTGRDLDKHTQTTAMIDRAMGGRR